MSIKPEALTPYVPLARRYRPQKFEGPGGLVGQPHVARTMKNGVASGQVAQAYLLAGPRGTGKTTAARILAAALNSTVRDEPGEPHPDCPVVQRIIRGQESNDVVEIDAATHRGAEDARALRQQAYYAPSSEQAYKVYILDEAHMLTREAWNALLKVLEEPPPRVVFVFATTEPEKIEQAAPAVLSRCQRLDLRRLQARDIVRHLTWIAAEEGIVVSEEALVLIARRAQGGMRDALSMLDQLRAFALSAEITADVVREAFGVQSESVLLSVIDILAKRDRERVFKLVRWLDAEGVDFVRFVEDVHDMLADLAELQAGGAPSGWSAAGLAKLKARATGEDAPPQAERLSTREIVEVLGVIMTGLRELRFSTRPQATVATLLQQAISLRAEAR